jgi:23S rRNA pseudouridine2604 synthase
MNIRINKYISEAGICSRRDADRKILAGKVRMNGRPAELGDTVGPNDKVSVDGNLIATSMQRIYLAYNKPMGITSTTDKADPDNIIKAVAYHGGRIFPVGRLDKDSEGLILLTNDGDIVNKILRVSNKHDKEYIVSVDKKITDDFINRMSNGVSILGVMTRKCIVEKINDFAFRIILNQGMNRQIRRMCKALDYKVTRLQRIRIMNIKIDGIAPGTWRFLTDEEIDKILADVGNSEKGEEGSGKNKSKSTGKWNSIEARDFNKSRKVSINPKSKENRKDGVGTKDSPDSYITGKIDHKSAGTGTRFSKPKGNYGASDSSSGGRPSKSGSGFRTKSKSIAKPGAGGRPGKPGSGTRPGKPGQKPKTGRGKGTGRGLK